MKMHQLLINAKALIDTPEKWIKGDYARAKYGVVSSLHPDAICFCSVGALVRASNNDAIAMTKALALFKGDYSSSGMQFLYGYQPTPAASLSQINDRPNMDHAQMMARWDQAILAAFTQDAVDEFLVTSKV